MAHRVGIQPGDRLVSVNTAVLHGLSHSECLDILSRPVTNVCLTLLRRRPADDATSDTTSGDSDASSEETTGDERESLPDGHSDGDGDAGRDEDGDNNVQLVQMSTNSCQSSIDAQVTSCNDRGNCQKCDECGVNDTEIGASKCKHNRCFSDVLTPVARDRYSTMNSGCDLASEVPISGDIQSARGDSSIFNDANDPKHDSGAHSAVEQERPSSLRGNELFAIRGPIVHPWRQQFNVLEGSFIDSNILKQHITQISSVSKDRGDTNRKCPVAKENTTTMQKSCGSIAEDQVVPELPSHDAVVTKMDNAGSTLDDTCLSPVSYDINTPKYNELIPGLNDDDYVFGNEEIESDVDLMHRNRHSETTKLKPPARGDTNVIVSPVMSPSCGTWSTFDESTCDDSYTFGDSLTPGQVRVALTSPFVELELELDSDYDISINSDCTLNEDTSLYPECRAKSIDDGGACLMAMCPAEDTIDVRRALFSPSDTTNASDEEETVRQVHQGDVPAEPPFHPEFKAQNGNDPSATWTSSDDQMAAPTCPLIRSPALLTNHAMAATGLPETADLSSVDGESPSVPPASLARRQQQHARLMSEVKAATELCRPSAAWLKPRPLSDRNKGPATDHCLEQQLLMMCGPHTCGGDDTDTSSLRTDWSDGVTVNWMQSENMHKGDIANGADGVVWTDGKDGTDSGYNTEKHHDDVGGRLDLSEVVNHHVSGQKLTYTVSNAQSQSFCQHLPSLSFNGQFGEQKQDHSEMSIMTSIDSLNVQLPNPSQDQHGDEVTQQCPLSMQELDEQEITNECNIYQFASPDCNERCILSQSAAKTVDFVPTQCHDSVSHVCVSQDTVTTATVLLQHSSVPRHTYQHCDTVEQGRGSPVSPTVMLRRAHHGTKEGDPQRQRSRLDEHNIQEQGSVKELERQSSQGDSDVTLPHPESDFTGVDATSVPENRGDSLCNTDTVGEGTGLSVAAGATIFPHEWQPMTVKPEECPGRSVTQTSGYTSSYDTVASTRECTIAQQVPLPSQAHVASVDTTIVSPSNQQRVTSLDTSDPDYSAIGCYPGSNLTIDEDHSHLTNLRESLPSEQWEDDPFPHTISDSLPECRNEDSDGPSLTSPGRLTEMSSSPRGWSQPAGCGSRSEDKPFQVQVLRSLLGVGISVSVTPSGVVITGIQKIGPVAKNGSVR